MLHVLLIDDEESERVFVNYLMKDRYQSDFTLHYAKDVLAAKMILGQNKVDIILLDDNLADGSNSTESVPVLQKQAFNVPIVIITKNSEARHLRERVSTHVNAIVDKFNLMRELSGGLIEEQVTGFVKK